MTRKHKVFIIQLPPAKAGGLQSRGVRVGVVETPVPSNSKPFSLMLPAPL